MKQYKIIRSKNWFTIRYIYKYIYIYNYKNLFFNLEYSYALLNLVMTSFVSRFLLHMRIPLGDTLVVVVVVVIVRPALYFSSPHLLHGGSRRAHSALD